jgi:hypothetical protein
VGYYNFEFFEKIQFLLLSQHYFTFASGGQGEGAWCMAFCAQRESCFRFAPCALRFANSPPGPVKHLQKLFIILLIC